jgi:hypothetical protein
MNQRIDQLWAQALDTAVPETYTRLSHSQVLKIKQVFADMIVRECAKKGFDIFDEEPDAPASDLQFYVRDRIKEHFGVES